MFPKGKAMSTGKFLLGSTALSFAPACFLGTGIASAKDNAPKKGNSVDERFQALDKNSEESRQKEEMTLPPH